MKVSFLILFAVLLSAACSDHSPEKIVNSGETGRGSTPAVQALSEITVCELTASPEKYQGKRIRVKGTYCDCAEDSRLYSDACAGGKKIWVEGTREKCANAGQVDDFRSSSKSDPERMWGAWQFDVVFEGRLTGLNGGYGHMNQYDYLFETDCISEAKRIKADK